MMKIQQYLGADHQFLLGTNLILIKWHTCIFPSSTNYILLSYEVKRLNKIQIQITSRILVAFLGTGRHSFHRLQFLKSFKHRDCILVSTLWKKKKLPRHTKLPLTADVVTVLVVVVQFLSDPGKPGVRSLGPDVRLSVRH